MEARCHARLDAVMIGGIKLNEIRPIARRVNDFEAGRIFVRKAALQHRLGRTEIFSESGELRVIVADACPHQCFAKRLVRSKKLRFSKRGV